MDSSSALRCQETREETMRRHLGLAAALTLAVAGVGGFAATTIAADYELRVASYAPEGDIIDRALQRFKEELEQRSDGRIEVTVFRNSTLGSNREALEMAKIGGVDFVVAGAPHVSNFAPILGAVSFPFLWKDRETMLEVLDSDLGDRLTASAEAQADGLKILAWWDTGFRHVTNNRKPIMTADDVQGLKIRTVPTPVQVAFWKAMGAIPTPMGWTEVMPALQQGVIDGQENPPAVVYPYKVYEFQKYYSLTGHSNEPNLLVASTQSMEALPADLQEAVVAAAAATTPFERQIAEEYNRDIMGELSKVIEINEVPEETLAKFREVAASIYEDSYADVGDDGKTFVEAVIQQTH
jgi:tripartite ATP-independent transporter DctP family solute receptor